MEDRTYVQRIIGDHSFIRLFVSFCSMIEISLLNPPSFLLSTLHQHTIRSYRVLSTTLIMNNSSHSPLTHIPFYNHGIIHVLSFYLYSPLVKNTEPTQTIVMFFVFRLALGSSILVIPLFFSITFRFKNKSELHSYPSGFLGVSVPFNCVFWLFVCKPLCPLHGFVVQEPSYCRCLRCHGISVPIRSPCYL